MKCPLLPGAGLQPSSTQEVTMVLSAAAVERAMKIQEVIMRALSGAITWLQAADILGRDPRSVRRWRARFETGRALALFARVRLAPLGPKGAGRRSPGLLGPPRGAFCGRDRPPFFWVRPPRPRRDAVL